MEVILLERVEKLGHIGDVVKVKDGFARNFLLPNKKALRANEANRKVFEANRERIVADNAAKRSEAEKESKSLEGISVTLIRQASNTGQLYGSVAVRDIVETLVADGHKVTKSQVVLDKPIKSIGLFEVKVSLHAEVTVTVKVNVARSPEEAEMQSQGWTWLNDADGKPITPEQLPDSLGLDSFANDQYRGALVFVRDVGYSQDDTSPAFQEFYWGQWLRDQTNSNLRPADFTLTDMASYHTLVGNIGAAMVALSDTTEIANGLDAKALGKLESFGQKAFDALIAPIDSDKPGKLAYAIAYKATL